MLHKSSIFLLIYSFQAPHPRQYDVFGIEKVVSEFSTIRVIIFFLLNISSNFCLMKVVKVAFGTQILITIIYL